MQRRLRNNKISIFINLGSISAVQNFKTVCIALVCMNHGTRTYFTIHPFCIIIVENTGKTTTWPCRPDRRRGKIMTLRFGVARWQIFDTKSWGRSDKKETWTNSNDLLSYSNFTAPWFAGWNHKKAEIRKRVIIYGPLGGRDLPQIYEVCRHLKPPQEEVRVTGDRSGMLRTSSHDIWINSGRKYRNSAIFTHNVKNAKKWWRNSTIGNWNILFLNWLSQDTAIFSVGE